MKPDDFDRLDNRDIYRAAMDHLPLPRDFERRTLALAEQKAAQLQERRAERDVWKAKPLYKRPAAQICFALLFVFVLSTLVILPMGINRAMPMNASLETAASAPQKNAKKEVYNAIPGATPRTAEEPEAGAEGDGGTENNQNYEMKSGSPEKDDASSTPALQEVAPDSDIAEKEQSANGGTSASPAPETRGVTPRMPVQGEGATIAGFALNLESSLASANGSVFCFQPAGQTVRFWDGSALKDTGVTGADSLLASAGGYYHTAANKLYHNAVLLRDFSGEALLSGQKFTVHVFGADGAYVYLYANPSGGETSPYTILRVSTDGTTEQILFSADGKISSGTIAQARLAGNTLYYALSEGGFYALNAGGGTARWLSGGTTAEPFYLWQNEILYLDEKNYLCSILTDGSGGKQLTGETAVSNIAVQGDSVFFMLGPDAHSTVGNGLYALDLKSGAISRVRDGAENFRRLFPASDGLFLLTSDGTAHFYSLTTKELQQLE